MTDELLKQQCPHTTDFFFFSSLDDIEITKSKNFTREKKTQIIKYQQYIGL